MPKLAHISDIHFGKTFHLETWKNVRKQIEGFKPDIVVVSGDLVDHPSALRLLAVKTELLDLCDKCSSKPQLFVVPGNHDVRLWGNIRIGLRPSWLDRLIMSSKWFERIMFNDTTVAVKEINERLGITLGMNANSRQLTWRRRLRRFDRWSAIRWNIRKNECDGRLQSCDRRSNDGPWPTYSECSQIAITCLDSNPGKGKRLAFASGEVGQDQITKLGREREVNQRSSCAKCGTSVCLADEPRTAILLRVAVLHHHALPIALTASSLKKKRRESDLEAFLVLRNSGDLLHQLQHRKFDIVLHGHKHKQQFALLQIDASRTDSYPLIVLAGGSTAKDDEQRADNTLRLIRTEASGRLIIETIENGQPDENTNPFRESLPRVKQRSIIRALERTKRASSLIRWEAKIDSVGNSRNATHVSELRSLRDGGQISGTPIGIAVSPYGQPFENLI